MSAVQSRMKNINVRYLSLFSISLVLASTVGMCLNTMPSMAFYNEKNEPVCVVEMIVLENSKIQNSSDQKYVQVDNPHLGLVEAFCISWFTLEYLLR